MVKEKSWADEGDTAFKQAEQETDREVSKAREKQQENERMANRRSNSCWTDGLKATVSSKSRADKVEHVKVKSTEIEAKKAVKHWFGYDEDIETDTSEDDLEEEDNWTTVEKKEKRKEKMRNSREKKKRKMEESARKAQSMVGLGPINEDMFEHYIKAEKNYEKAKLKTVRQYLRLVYKYDEEEIENLIIEETEVTRRDDIYIYIAVSNIQDIKDIYRRKAEVRCDDTILRSYVPPQFYTRFNALNGICADRMKSEGDLKTQICFGHKDLEVLLKTKGSDKPFMKVNLKEFIGNDTIPDFDQQYEMDE